MASQRHSITFGVVPPSPRRRTLAAFSMAEVGAWFVELKLGEYAANITENEINGEMLQDLIDNDGLVCHSH